MLFQIFFSLLFILPLLGTMSVVLQSLKIELSKKNVIHQNIHTLKLMGYSMLATTGLYLALFLLGLIWIPDFDLPDTIKTVSFCLAVPYLLSVIGISFAMKNATAANGSPTKLVQHVSDEISN